MRGSNPYEIIAASIVCATIMIAAYQFIRAMQGVQDIVVTEAAEMKFIRAIYVGEFARNFVEFGAEHILNAFINNYLAGVGGIIDPSYDTGLRPAGGEAGGKLWLNFSSEGELGPTHEILKDQQVPVSQGDKITYYKWCNTTEANVEDCQPILIYDVIDEDIHQNIIENQTVSQFTSNTYMDLFAQKSEFRPDLLLENPDLEFVSNDLEFNAQVRIIVRPDESAWVESVEDINVTITIELLNMINEAVLFVNGDGLDNAAVRVDLCDTSKSNADLAQDFITEIIAETGGVLGAYTFNTEQVEISIQPTTTGKSCATIDSVQILDGTFKFRTEFKTCRVC